MRRLAVIVAVALAVPVLAVTAWGDDGSGDTYRITAVFDNAAFLAEGEELKVAGAGIGEIEKVELTGDREAAVTFRVDDSRFTPFHANAHCTIRSEGLLAVKFVECDPGTTEAPELATIESGIGEGTHELPISQTSTPVDLDLVLGTYREPTGRQLALMLSELGVGLAARGEELNEVIHRSVPAFRQTTRVFKILAGQNRELAQFAVDADSVATALASKRRELAGFVTSAAGTAETAAASSEEIAQSIDRLPRFLRELRPAVRDLSRLTREGTPVLTQLGESGHDLGRAMTALKPVARDGIPALEALGRFADEAGPDYQRLTHLIDAATALSKPLKPLGVDLGKLSTSLRDKQFRERLLQFFYYGTGTVNGFDAEGHYARIEVLSSACSEYTTRGFNTCDANWGGQAEVVKPLPASAGKAAGPIDPAPGKAGRAGRAGGASAEALLDFLLGDDK